MHYRIEYKGKIPSLNKWYSSTSWHARWNDKIKFSKIFMVLMKEAGIRPMDKFRIEIEYNSRLDLDNVITLPKMLIDTMKGVYIKDDTKKYYRGLSIEPNEQLSGSTYIIKIYPLDGD